MGHLESNRPGSQNAIAAHCAFVELCGLVINFRHASHITMEAEL